MARPRIHDIETMLDATERLAARDGVATVTMRAVATEAGASNGALYHSFESRAELLAHTWLRAMERYVTIAAEPVARTVATGAHVADGALAIVVLGERFPDSARFLAAVGVTELAELSAPLPVDVAAAVARAMRAWSRLVASVARALWGRADRYAIATVTLCLVGLPATIVLARTDDAAARTQLRVAVEAIVANGRR
ncbi:TetR/AcrR family transcriptional regulator [Nocardia camponoti]|uniref:Transcriptional regulator, TetR n=1 Tax=Nocardia camponoti TaxID=1616106 RepID=A0A917Q8L4_9NOCA|nr:TetR/AcrR family transcriptional regulator [Nocardia camponoti]GGK36476.1 putative transcriptional regulator, TetR [Nocardia camponoti]